MNHRKIFLHVPYNKLLFIYMSKHKAAQFTLILKRLVFTTKLYWRQIDTKTVNEKVQRPFRTQEIFNLQHEVIIGQLNATNEKCLEWFCWFLLFWNGSILETQSNVSNWCSNKSLLSSQIFWKLHNALKRNWKYENTGSFRTFLKFTKFIILEHWHQTGFWLNIFCSGQQNMSLCKNVFRLMSFITLITELSSKIKITKIPPFMSFHDYY